MNYYPFHVGDYTTHTAHLDPIEDLAYRRMLDMYYLREEQLPADIAQVARLIRLRDYEREVQSVLDEFFRLTDEGWAHDRCDAELEKMQDKQAKARASAKASVKARKANAQRKGGDRSAEDKHPLDEDEANAKRTLSERSTGAKRTLNVRSTDAELPTPTPTPIEEQKPSGAKPPEPVGPRDESDQAEIILAEPTAGQEPVPIRSRGCTFATFVAECRAKGEKPIPEDHPVFRFADDAGIPVEFVRLAWLEFRRDFGEGKGSKKRQAGIRGWRQHFDNAVRKGWYRLWAFDRQGECYLTPAGIALQREAEARDAA